MPDSAAIWLSAVGALALALMAACGGGTAQTPLPGETEQASPPSGTEQTPLPGAIRDCQHAAQFADAVGEMVDCVEAKAVALFYSENPSRREDLDKYWLIPLRVASVEDFRVKRDWAWEHWDVWEREKIDVCDVEAAPMPDDLIFELAYDDFKPPQCP